MFAASDGMLVYAGGGTMIAFPRTICCVTIQQRTPWTVPASSLDQHAFSQAVYYNGRIKRLADC